MKKQRIALASLVLALAVTIIGTPIAVSADSHGKPGLFVNLTTDDTWAATKAVMFAHKKALKAGHKPVAIWLNVRGIYLADRNRASHTHGLMTQSVHDMLKTFVKDGGRVIACQACSKAAGLTEDDFIDGVEMGNPDLVFGFLFDPNVKSLSW